MTLTAVGMGAYQYARVADNEEYLTRRNFRVLAIGAHQVQESIHSIALFLEAAAQEALATGTVTEVQKTLDEFTRQRTGGAGRVAFKSDVKEAAGPDSSTFGVRFRSGVRAEVEVTHWLRQKGIAIVFTATADLRSLLEPFLIDGVFTSVVLLDENGRVLLAMPRDLELTELRIGPPGPGVSPGPSGPPPKSPPPSPSPAPPEVVAEGPLRQEITVADQAYHVFHQPLVIRTPGEQNAQQPQAFICGFIPAARFRSESLALNPFWVAIAIMSLIGGTLCWPLLKLISLGPTERVGVHELIFISLALGLGTALAAVLGLDAIAYNTADPWAGSASQSTDAQLERLSREIRAVAHRQLRGALGALECARDKVGVFPPSPRPSRPTRLELTRLSQQCSVEWRRAGVSSVALVSRAGHQTARWTEGTGDAPLFDVRDRDYFRAVQQGGTWRVPWDSWRFFADPIWSRTDGDLIAAFSSDTRGAGAAGKPEDPTVVTVGLKPPSLIRPILPSGFGFAIISPEGKTLFHSDIKRTVEENFFEECSDPRRLRAAVLAHTEEITNARYWGRDHRLLVTPLPGTPWSLVVFRDKDLLRFAHIEILSVCTATVVALVILLGVYGAWARCLLGRGSEYWLWPRRGLHRVYGMLAVLLLVPGVLALALTAGGEARLALLGTLLLPLSALGLAAGALGGGLLVRSSPKGGLLGLARRYAILHLTGLPLLALAVAGTGSGTARTTLGAAALFLLAGSIAVVRPPSHEGATRAGPFPRWGYFAFVLALVFSAGAAPAAAVFRLAWERELESVIRHAQVDLARRVDDREARLNQEPPAVPPSSLGWVRRGQHRNEHPEKDKFTDKYLYSSFFYETRFTLAPAPAQAKSRLPPGQIPATEHPRWAVLNSWADSLPVFSESIVRLRGLMDARAADGSWWASSDSDTWRAGQPLSLTYARTADAGQVVVRSLSRPFWIAWSPWLVALVGLQVLFVWLVVRLVLRRLFLVDFKPPETLTVAHLAQAPITANLFVVGAPLGDKRPLQKRLQADLVDLGRERGSPAELRRRDFARPRGGLLGFDRFELILHDATQRLALLETLESALAAPIPAGQESEPAIVILSEIEPELGLGLEAAAGEGQGGPDQELRRRWCRVLGRFARVMSVDPGDPSSLRVEMGRAFHRLWPRTAVPGLSSQKRALRVRALWDLLWAECHAHRHLQALAPIVASEPGFETYDRERIARQVRDLAEGYYRALWMALSEREKLVLAHLARGHLVNPRAGRELNRLLAHRLVVQDAGFHTVNQSFARFVVTVTRPDEVRTWERSGAASLWTQLRAPAGIAVLALLGFLAYTQRDLVPTALGVLAAGIPLLSKLLDLLRTSPARPPSA